MGGICFCQSADFLKGEALFKENKVEEAVPFLKNAISQGGNPKAYNYLALSYHKMGMHQESLEVCSDGMKVSGTDKKVLAFNAGNVCFDLGDYYTAERWYSLAIAANRIYAPPVLNRANTELKQQKFLAALEDYKLYLDLSPNDRQKPEIEQIIALLEGWKKSEDDRIAEEQRLKEEEERIFAEQKRIEAEEARLAADAEKAAKEKEAKELDAALQKQLDEKFAEQAALLEAQREELRKLIEEQKAAQEAQRIETARREEEAARREAESALRATEAARKAEEDAARRRKLLEDVAASLQNSGSSNMNAGAEGTIDYGYETELE
ncbi:tetratricopeptide repeat protein [Treponema sp.]|uniref:tetratricopeptide repeat protein n=1 Tax=Treponema sp. TaxID=166 RepID=UPI003890B810